MRPQVTRGGLLPAETVGAIALRQRRLIRKLACGLGLHGATKTHSGRNLLSIKRLCSKRGIGRSTSVGLFSNSEPDKVQRVIPQRAAAEPTARQRRPGGNDPALPVRHWRQPEKQ